MELSEQSVVEGISRAGLSRDIYVDRDPAQQDKVRGLGKDRAIAAEEPAEGLPLVLWALEVPFSLCPRNHLLVPGHSTKSLVTAHFIPNHNIYKHEALSTYHGLDCVLCP